MTTVQQSSQLRSPLGGDFCLQPATFDNPEGVVVLLLDKDSRNAEIFISSHYHPWQ